jgi:PEP-CTERM motif
MGGCNDAVLERQAVDQVPGAQLICRIVVNDLPARSFVMRTQPLVVALRSACAASLLLLTPVASVAGYVTTNEAGVDAIYSQAGFDGNGVDIFFDVPLVLNRPDLLVLDSAAKLNALRDATTSLKRPTINMYFVDTITFCGFDDSFSGCASLGGNFIAIDSGYARTNPNGANAVAHELGHSLGLDHFGGARDGNNLMNAVVSASSVLTAGQITTIMASTLLLTEPSGRKFVTVSPVAVIPEPSTAAMWLLGAAALAIAKRKSQLAISALPAADA